MISPSPARPRGQVTESIIFAPQRRERIKVVLEDSRGRRERINLIIRESSVSDAIWLNEEAQRRGLKLEDNPIVLLIPDFIHRLLPDEGKISLMHALEAEDDGELETALLSAPDVALGVIMQAKHAMYRGEEGKASQPAKKRRRLFAGLITMLCLSYVYWAYGQHLPNWLQWGIFP